ncbi:MAG: hypothetical protein V4640_05385 [Verrucomicrobiota bacterium]
MAFDFEDLAWPPTGGRLKLFLLGILVPGCITWSSARSWIEQEAYWPASRGSGMVVHGEAAQAMALVYLSVALFMHSRWCWGLLPVERLFRIGTVVSFVLFLSALLYAVTCL